MARFTISLLHATYKAGERAVQTRDTWLRHAACAGSVEHLFSCNADDEISLRLGKVGRLIVNPPLAGQVTAVRNWNAAAAGAKGELLVVIADDLTPPPAWDDRLRELLAGADPAVIPAVAKLTDSPFPDDRLIRHPVLTRAFFKRQGLFDPAFRGVFCDDDFTIRAFRSAPVLDGRTIQCIHDHPMLKEGSSGSLSHSTINASTEYVYGEAVFRAKWRGVRGCVARKFFPGVWLRRVSPSGVRLWCAWLISVGYARGCGRAVVRRLRLREPSRSGVASGDQAA